MVILEKKQLLLVEDEALLAMHEKMELESYGYDVITAYNGEDAIEIAGNSHHIDLILMDINLGSGMDGTEAAIQILKKKEYPVVFLSSHTEPEIVDKTEKITSYGYVVKNSGITVLDASIKMAFKLFEANKLIKEREKRYESLFTNNHTVLLLINPDDGIIWDANPAACQYYSYTKEQLLSMRIQDIVQSSPKESYNEIKEPRDGKREYFEFRHRLSNGEIRDVEVYSSPIIIGDEQLLYFIIHDVTEKHKAEAALKVHKDRLELIYNATSNLMVLLEKISDNEFCIVSSNNALWKAIHPLNPSISQEQIQGITIHEMASLYNWSKSGIDMAIENYKKVLESNEPVRKMQTIITPVGKVVLDATYIPVISEKNRHILFTGEIITERIKAEEERDYLVNTLKRTGRMAKTGGWEFDPESLEGTWTEQVALIHEVDPMDPTNVAKGLSFYINESLDKIVTAVENCINKAEPYDLELETKTAKGNIKWVHTIGEPVVKNGKVVKVVGSIQDVTERKLIEQGMKENEELIKAVIDNLPIGIAVNSVDPTVAFEYMNEKFPLFYRTTKEKLSDPDSFWEAAYEDEVFREEIKSRVLSDISSGNPELFYWQDIPVSRKGKETTYITAMNIPIPHKKLMISTVWDVTMRKNLEDKLRSSNSFNEALLNASPDAIYIYDIVEKRNIYTNSGIDDILGYSVDEIQNMGDELVKSLMHPDDYEQYVEKILPQYQTAKDKDLIEHDYRMKHNKKHWVWLHSKESIFSRMSDGKPCQIFGIIADITEQKEAEEELIQKNKLIMTILDSIPQTVFWKDSNSVYLGCNKRFLKAVGLGSSDEVVGKTDFDLPWNEEDAKAYRKDDQEVIKNKKAKEHILETVRLADGSKILVDTTKVPLIDSNDTVYAVLGVYDDITERKKLEDELSNSELTYRLLFNSMGLGFYLSDIIYNEEGIPFDYRYIDVNSAFEKIVGSKKDQIIGKNFLDHSLSEPEINWMECFRRVASTGIPENYTFTSKIYNRYFEVYAFKPSEDKFAALIKDISDRVVLEKRINNLLKEKEILLKEVNHRIKNNLNVVHSLLSLQSNALSNPEAKRALQDAANRVLSTKVLYDTLFKNDDLTDVSVKNYLPLLIEKIKEIFTDHSKIKVITHIEDIILNDKTASTIGLIINELMTNAMKFAFLDYQNGTISITVKKYGKNIMIEFEDNGIGLPKSFDIKNAGGFGMYLIDSLVQQIHGTIKIIKENGTAFIITFKENSSS